MSFLHLYFAMNKKKNYKVATPKFKHEIGSFNKKQTGWETVKN